MTSFLVGTVTACIITLGFGATVGGHPHAGVDYYCGYLSPVYSPYDGTVLFRDDSNGSIALVVGTSSQKIFIVEHMATTTVAVGSKVKAGDMLGREGYKGEVYNYGRRENSPAASHRHYGLYLLVEDSTIRSFTPSDSDPEDRPQDFYIVSEEGWYKNERGNYLKLRDPYNEYEGACDPLNCS